MNAHDGLLLPLQVVVAYAVEQQLGNLDLLVANGKGKVVAKVSYGSPALLLERQELLEEVGVRALLFNVNKRNFILC